MWHLGNMKAYQNDVGTSALAPVTVCSSGVAVQFGGKAVQLVFRLKNCSCSNTKRYTIRREIQ